MGNDLAAADGSYPDYLPWNDFQDELDRYPSIVQLTRQDKSLCAIPNFANIPSPSELVVASSRTSINTPETSVMSLEYAAVPGIVDFVTAVHSDNAVPEFEAVVLAEAEWNLARCNPPPPPGHCPKTAVVHLRFLEQKSKQEGTWSALEEYLEKVEGDASDLAPASTLLVLLMIAQGAAAMPLQEARYLSAGLTETCRISLFDIVEKDVGLSADPTTLRCALLFLVLGAWSGDKWLMDIAMGQRGMYMSMLKHAGMLGSQTAKNPKFDDNAMNSEVQWRAWVERETRHRLVYNYVMLDQELSLFHDTAPLFAITELQCPLPSPEVLWITPHPAGCPVTKESILHRLDEVQALLQKWYDITMNYSKTNPGCPATHCNLIMYHLVSLNTVADFSEIERLARREEFGGLRWELPIRHGKCIFHRQKTIIHCGQVIRLLRLMPKERRPAWWPAAMSLFRS
ncbi:hypothetical protein VTG60DRAFT_3221 [Thermothelomyces hinnuleus]